MTFNQIKYHIEGLGCSLDPYIDDAYWAANCVNGNTCVIERASDYSEPTLCHYFYELGISAPDHLKDVMEIYRSLRADVDKYVVETEAAEDEDEE